MAERQPSSAPRPSRRSVLGLLGAVPLAAAGVLNAPGVAFAGRPPATRVAPLADRIADIMARPVFAGSEWGMGFYSMNTRDYLYALRPDSAFIAASAVKIFIGGTAFDALGVDHRFRTRVYRTGPVAGGVLPGDLVLVAGGDLLLSGRLVRGTLALPDPDHSYPGGPPLPGDPLRELRELARQVARRIRRVEGRVVVDASLFREGREDIASGAAPITVSPMMVNDNLVTVTVAPGPAAGAPARVSTTPTTGYLRLDNQVTTVATGGATPALAADVLGEDGTHTVTVTGGIAVGAAERYLIYYVPEPVRFAEVAFAEALRDCGVEITGQATGQLPAHDRPRRLVAERVSPGLPDETKVMLKVSSNIHTVAFPYLIGAIAGHDAGNPKAAYDALRRDLFVRSDVDADPPGAADGRYSSDTFIRFLTYLARQPYYPRYRDALPIMGRDGSLATVQPDSPAAGHVFAKTGTGISRTSPTSNPTLYKALAGYLELPDGHRLAFAQFMNQATASPADATALAATAGEAMGEIATAVYESLTTGGPHR